MSISFTPSVPFLPQERSAKSRQTRISTHRPNPTTPAARLTDEQHGAVNRAMRNMVQDYSKALATAGKAVSHAERLHSKALQAGLTARNASINGEPDEEFRASLQSAQSGADAFAYAGDAAHEIQKTWAIQRAIAKVAAAAEEGFSDFEEEEK